MAALVWRPAGGQSFIGRSGSMAFGWTHRHHAARLHGNIVQLHKLAVIKPGKQTKGKNEKKKSLKSFDQTGMNQCKKQFTILNEKFHKFKFDLRKS